MTTPQLPETESVARAIAGQDYDDAFECKADWVAARGLSGGRFRDVNEPFKADYLDQAERVIALYAAQMQEHGAAQYAEGEKAGIAQCCSLGWLTPEALRKARAEGFAEALAIVRETLWPDLKDAAMAAQPGESV